ncbi:MAG: DUF3578 domain-containing protein [Taibaiella sp.]|nr:DUF3578 domain-containing protein [Taibaiella sp.]
MERILREPLETYSTQKTQKFVGNPLANKLRGEYQRLLEEILPDRNRYLVVGSPGKGNWASCPWIAILDSLITDTAQSGYYPVLIFKEDMTGVYLSLNQGVTRVKEYYKRNAKNVLRVIAQDYRAKIEIDNEDLTEIDLASRNNNAKLYEAGNIIAKYYPADNLPTTTELIQDVRRFLNLYEELIFNDTQIDETKNLTALEKKQYRLHFRIERNSNIANKVKQHKGYKCEGCKFTFSSMYGSLGKEFIEAHHLIPISTLNLGNVQVNIETDFAVLCSNCHSMIHRLDDPSNLELLQKIIKDNLT